MISDVLAEVVGEINQYLKDQEYQRKMYGDELLNDVKSLVSRMDKVRNKLDVHPVCSIQKEAHH